MEQRNTPQTEGKTAGHKYGIALLVTGAFIIIINIVSIWISDKYFPKLSVMGMTLVILAPIFFIFRGGKLDDITMTPDLRKKFWAAAPTAHKIIWIVWGIVSIGISFYALLQLDPDFTH